METQTVQEPDDENARCSRCLRERPSPYYSDGIGDNAIFNGQPICDECAEQLEDFA